MKRVLQTLRHANIIPPILHTYVRLRLDLLDNGRGSEPYSKKKTMFFRVLEHSMESFFFFVQCHHMSFVDFVVLPPGHGRSVTDF